MIDATSSSDIERETVGTASSETAPGRRVRCLRVSRAPADRRSSCPRRFQDRERGSAPPRGREGRSSASPGRRRACCASTGASCSLPPVRRMAFHARRDVLDQIRAAGQAFGRRRKSSRVVSGARTRTDERPPSDGDGNSQQRSTRNQRPPGRRSPSSSCRHTTSDRSRARS